MKIDGTRIESIDNETSFVYKRNWEWTAINNVELWNEIEEIVNRYM